MRINGTKEAERRIASLLASLYDSDAIPTRSDSLLSAVKDIGGNAARVSWDGEEYVAVDATKVYLGTAAFKEKEPVLLGATTQDWMRDLLSELQRLGKALAGVSTAGSSAPGLAQIKSPGASMAGPLGSIKKAIDDLDSIKVFTE